MQKGKSIEALKELKKGRSPSSSVKKLRLRRYSPAPFNKHSKKQKTVEK
jgi:ribosomal protein S21